MAHSTPLYGLTALFDTPDALVHAVDEAVKRGYTKFDAHTPYPVHGLDRRAKLSPSKLGFFAFGFGLIGTLTAVSLMTWVTTTEYPMVIGGKPFWTWPAFVPVAFELTVLLATVLSTLTMIVLYFKFPNTGHPLHDTPYMKAVSADRFGLCIQADDPSFDEKHVRAFFDKVHGTHIASVHYDAAEYGTQRRVFEPQFLALLAGVAIVTSGAAYVTLNILLYLPPFDFMMEQAKLTPQKASTLFADGIGMRPPVKGTVARGFLPYAFAGKPEEAAKALVNPLLPTESVLARGRAKYLTYCSPCHGNFGAGDSRLRGQFPNPPTLHSDKVRTWPDGSIYHVITEGQNVMPSYAAQLSRDDRWAVINYIRVLERAHQAKEGDVR
jgi:mono/diheme cytochrome c family protein